MTLPARPKLYHIAHVDCLPSIVADACLWCDAEVSRRAPAGTMIGISSIKQRRLSELTLSSHPGLHVGDCVPFYFCARSVMLYLIYQGNHPELAYRGGQGPIIHFEADLGAVVDWADRQGRHWAFTLSNAGSRFFEDRCELAQLSSRIAANLPNSARSTGMPCRRATGGSARKGSRRSFYWSTVYRGIWLSASACCRDRSSSRCPTCCQQMDTGQRSK